MVLPEPEFGTVQPWVYGVVMPLQRLLLSLYFRQIEIQGLEHLPMNGPVVLVPKHFSRWDPLVVALLSVEPFRFMTNANQFSGVQGWLLPRLGAFPVDLARPKVSSFRTAIAILQAGHKLIIFPEGGIVRDRPVRALKPGFARLVLQAEAALSQAASQPVTIPIVPIALRYRPAAQARAAITLRIAPPLSSAAFADLDDKQQAIALTAAVQTTLERELAAIGWEPLHQG